MLSGRYIYAIVRDTVRSRSAYVFVAPFVLIFAAFTILPIILTVLTSLQDVGFFGTSTWIGLGNYENLANDQVFWLAVMNSIGITAIVVPVATISGLVLAGIATALPYRWQNLVRGGFYLPAVASGLVLTMVWLWILHPVHGVLNYIVGAFGIGPIEWIGRTDTALWSVALVVLSFSLGQPIILFIAAFNGIPKEIYEAALLDGAGSIRKFLSISIPLVRPVLALVVVILTLGTFQVFVVVKIMTLGGPANATQTLVFRVWQMAFTRGEFGLAAAMGVVLLVIGLGMAVIQMKLLSSDVSYT